MRLADHQISLRPATDADLSFLLELRLLTMTAHQIASGVTPSDDERLRRVRLRFECAEIVSFDGRAVGLLKVARDDNDWELIQIQLHPDFQGQGIGRGLVESVIVQAREAGAVLHLSVLKQNPARRLYEKLGFVVVSENAHSLAMRLAPQCHEAAELFA
jgi:ribosomal protein S18 acetylase RimI-like enzyme